MSVQSSSKRKLLIALPVTAVVAFATVSVATPGASAAPDPITGGTTTIAISQSTIDAFTAQGLSLVPVKPATLTYDPSVANHYKYVLPVTGGNGSTQTLFGVVKNGGGLRIHDNNTGKTVTLKKINFTVQDDTLSATPSDTTTPVVFFDAAGQHTFVTSQPESFHASDLQVDPAGAAYLNAALGETVFTAEEHIGGFTTSFTNTVG